MCATGILCAALIPLENPSRYVMVSGIFFLMSSWIYSISVKLFSLMFNCYGLCSRDVKTGLPELMVNFVTSSYKPELLEPLVEKISSIPEVVCMRNFHFQLCLNITLVISLFSLGLVFEWFKGPSLGFDKLD